MFGNDTVAISSPPILKEKPYQPLPTLSLSSVALPSERLVTL